METTQGSRHFYPRLEALRGLAAASVVIFHILQHYVGLSPSIFGTLGWPTALFYFSGETIFNGGAAVVLFFVLSGFVMGVNINMDQRLTLSLYLRFMVRRVFRLWPIIILAVPFSGACVYLYSGRVISLNEAVGMVTLYYTDLDAPLWSIRVEFVMSAIYLFLLFGMARVPPTIRIFLVFVALSSCMAHSSVTLDGYLRYVMAFLLGILVPTFGQQMMRELGERTRLLLPFVFLILYASVSIVGAYQLIPNGFVVYLMQVSGAFFIVCYVMFSLPQHHVRLFDSRTARYLGRISYSLYALHYPMIFVFGSVISRLNLPPVGKTLLLFLVAAPICIVVAELATRFVERPMIEIGKRLTSRREPLNPAAVRS